MVELEVNKIHLGDCLDVMSELPANCIDTIITDPPYALTNRTPDVLRCVDCRRVLGGRDGRPDACPRCGGQVTGQRTGQNRGFMGKEWDNEIAFNPAVWGECLRVAKPGATLMAFGGTRTHHRLMVAIEDAGWEIRDCIANFHDGSQAERSLMASLNDEQLAAYLELHHPNQQMAWVYGSGFPKSLDIGKAIDKAAIIECLQCSGDGIGNRWLEYYCPEHGKIEDGGSVCRYDDCNEGAEYTEEYDLCSACNGTGKVKGAEREVVGISPNSRFINNEMYANGNGFRGHESYKGDSITAPSTPLAQDFDGWGSALKPAYEPIIIAMKPIDQSFANNAEKWGVSGLNIDGGRVETEEIVTTHSRGNNGAFPKRVGEKTVEESGRLTDQRKIDPGARSGRFPSNLIHSGEPSVMAEFDKAPKVQKCGTPKKTNHTKGMFGLGQPGQIYRDKSDTPARYFAHCPPDTEPARLIYQAKAGKKERGPYNNHPCVKPLSLVKYLVRLTRTPDGGIVLDPFAGSGTVALAALSEGREFILIEKEPEYIEIIKRRIAEYTGKEIAPKEIKITEDKTAKQLSLW